MGYLCCYCAWKLHPKNNVPQRARTVSPLSAVTCRCSREPVLLPRPNPKPVDRSGEATRTTIGPTRLRNPCSSSTRDTPSANDARLALRIFTGVSIALLTYCQPMPPRPPASHGMRVSLQEAPVALKPSFLHLSPLAPIRRRAFPLGLNALTSVFSHSSTPLHHLYQPHPAPRPSRLLAERQPHRRYRLFSRVCRMLHCLLDC